MSVETMQSSIETLEYLMSNLTILTLDQMVEEHDGLMEDEIKYTELVRDSEQKTQPLFLKYKEVVMNGGAETEEATEIFEELHPLYNEGRVLSKKLDKITERLWYIEEQIRARQDFDDRNN